MRKSQCCMAPATTHGARRRRCTACGRTWTQRPRRRGRKQKRTRVSLAEAIMVGNASLRGLATIRKINRETLRRRCHKSLKEWCRSHVLLKIPQEGRLIAIVDALWFKLGDPPREYGCYVVLLRSVASSYGIPALIVLRPGHESKTQWRRIFSLLPATTRHRIVAVISDGFTGMISLAKEYGWYFQWCHAHIKRKVFELRGFRKLPGRNIRRQVTSLIYEFLETPDEKLAEQCLKKIRRLFSRSGCPHSLIYRLSSILKRSTLFRAYLRVPAYNLPVTTNSVEQINNQIRRRHGLMRGVRSVRSLRYWLNIIHRSIKPIYCRGFKETIKFYRNSVS